MDEMLTASLQLDPVTEAFKQIAREAVMDESTETQIARKMGQMLGYVPVGTRDLLHILVHPDVIELTAKYVAERQELLTSEREADV